MRKMKGGRKMKTKNSWKEFFRPSLSKMFIIVILIASYFLFSNACEPFSASFQGYVYPCGETIYQVYNLTDTNPWFGLVWLG